MATTATPSPIDWVVSAGRPSELSTRSAENEVGQTKKYTNTQNTLYDKKYTCQSTLIRSESSSEDRLHDDGPTNAERVMRFLALHPDQAFTQSEICEGRASRRAVSVSSSRASKIVTSFVTKGNYWALGEDDEYRSVRQDCREARAPRTSGLAKRTWASGSNTPSTTAEMDELLARRRRLGSRPVQIDRKPVAVAHSQQQLSLVQRRGVHDRDADDDAPRRGASCSVRTTGSRAACLDRDTPHHGRLSRRSTRQSFDDRVASASHSCRESSERC